MKFLPLLWKNLFRRKVRTLFTLMSIVVAFVRLCCNFGRRRLVA